MAREPIDSMTEKRYIVRVPRDNDGHCDEVLLSRYDKNYGGPIEDVCRILLSPVSAAEEFGQKICDALNAPTDSGCKVVPDNETNGGQK